MALMVGRSAMRSLTGVRRTIGVVRGFADHAVMGPGGRGRLPPGNDPAAYHSPEAAKADMERWRTITTIFAFPVAGYTIMMVNETMKHEEHHEEIPAYDYLQVASRSPRFPWG